MGVAYAMRLALWVRPLSVMTAAGHVVTRQIFNPSEFEHTASVLLAALDSKRLEGFKHRRVAPPARDQPPWDPSTD